MTEQMTEDELKRLEQAAEIHEHSADNPQWSDVQRLAAGVRRLHADNERLRTVVLLLARGECSTNSRDPLAFLGDHEGNAYVPGLKQFYAVFGLRVDVLPERTEG